MRFAVAILLGFALVILLPGQTFLISAVGAIAGFGYMVAESLWPRPKATYIDQVNRPKPSKPAASYVMSIVLAIMSAVFAIFAWNVIMPRLPGSGLYGIYVAAAGVGVAIGMALMAKRNCDAHNRWLAAMTPRTQLDF